MKLTLVGLPSALLAASLFAACQNTARGIEQDTEKNTAAVKEATQEATRDAKARAEQATEATKEYTREAAQRSKEAAGTFGAKIDAAQQTMDVKTALMADKNVDASGINVDTSAETKTVMLKGHVKTAAEKERAGEIAKQKAPGYTIVNHLEVRMR